MKGNFKELVQTDQMVLVDFFADWCGPCQTLAPILKDVKSELGDDLKIIKVDVDKNQPLATQFGVRSVPTLILFRQGEQLWKQAGAMTKSDLLHKINSYQ